MHEWARPSSRFATLVAGSWTEELTRIAISQRSHAYHDVCLDEAVHVEIECSVQDDQPYREACHHRRRCLKDLTQTTNLTGPREP